MASINGLSLKAVKDFCGRGGEPLCQGKLYLNNKKIAFWSQDAGGCIMDDVVMNDGLSEELLRKEIISLNKDKEESGVADNGNTYCIKYDLEKLVTDLLILIEREKAFKKAVKNGYELIVIVSNGIQEAIFQLGKVFEGASDNEIIGALSKKIDTVKNDMYQGYTFETLVYRSLNDFNVGKPINLDAIK